MSTQPMKIIAAPADQPEDPSRAERIGLALLFGTLAVLSLGCALLGAAAGLLGR